MTFDPRLQRHIDGHPFPLLFATISGRTSTVLPRPIPISTCGACIFCRWNRWSASTSGGRRSKSQASTMDWRSIW